MFVRFRHSTSGSARRLTLAAGICLGTVGASLACATVTQEDPPSNQTGSQGGGGAGGLGGAAQGGGVSNGGSSPGSGGSSPSFGGSTSGGNAGSFSGGTGGVAQGGTGGSAGQGGSGFNPPLSVDAGLPGTVLIQDDFENGDGLWTAPTGSWTLTTDPGASGNVYSQTDSTANAPVLAAPNGSFTDFTAQVDFKVVTFGGQSSDNMAGLCVRVADASNFYMIGQRSNNGNYIQLRRFGSGATILNDARDFDQPVNTWHRLRVEVIGSNITAYLNGNLMFTHSDSGLTGGGIALCSSEASVMFDNFIVTDGP